RAKSRRSTRSPTPNASEGSPRAFFATNSRPVSSQDLEELSERRTAPPRRRECKWVSRAKPRPRRGSSLDPYLGHLRRRLGRGRSAPTGRGVVGARQRRRSLTLQSAVARHRAEG